MLSRLRGKARIPVVAILVNTVVGGALFLLSTVAGDIYSLMVNFTTGGFYLAFLFPLIGFVVAGAAGLDRRRVHARPRDGSGGRGGRCLGGPADAQYLLALCGVRPAVSGLVGGSEWRSSSWSVWRS